MENKTSKEVFSQIIRNVKSIQKGNESVPFTGMDRLDLITKVSEKAIINIKNDRLINLIEYLEDGMVEVNYEVRKVYIDELKEQLTQ